MRLKLNLEDKDNFLRKKSISWYFADCIWVTKTDMFCVSKTSICKIVTTWVCLLANIFNGTLFCWPNREEVKQQFRKSFKKYPDTRVIIDATEFFSERPTSPCAQKATWSDYKHHNTVKLLVGITPCGAFTFISKL